MKSVPNTMPDGTLERGERLVPQTPAETRVLRRLLARDLRPHQLAEDGRSYEVDLGDHLEDGWYELAFSEQNESVVAMVSGHQVRGRIAVVDTQPADPRGRTELWWHVAGQTNHLPYYPLIEPPPP